MSQSLSRMHVHLVFSTKNRVPWLLEPIRDSVHAYLAAVLKDIGCPAVLIDSMEDHVHILFALGRTTALSTAVEQIKKASSKWIKTQGADFAGFAWQAGYGAFSVSESNLTSVRNYIAGQRVHHRVKTFEDEFRAFLELHSIASDERYVWD
jgi:putative transposase